MAHTDRFRLGPLTDMTELEGIPAASGVKVAYEQIGGRSLSLRGRASADVWATKRQWTLAWPLARRPMVDRLVTRWLATSQGGAAAIPWRLYDAYQQQLVPTDAAWCGAHTLTPASAGPVGGITPWAIVTAGRATHTFVPMGAMPVVTDVTAGDLTRALRAVDLAHQSITPVNESFTLQVAREDSQRIPTFGRPMIVRLYVRGSGSVDLNVNYLNAAGSYVTGNNTGNFALSGTWQGLQLSTTPTQVAAAERSAALLLSITGRPASSSAAARLECTGLSVEHQERVTPSNPNSAVIPPAWSPLSAVPEVEFWDLKDGYAVLGRRSIELTLREV